MMKNGKVYKTVDLNAVPIELLEALWVAIPDEDKKTLQSMIAKGKNNQQIAAWLSTRRCQIDSFRTVTGEWVDFRTSPQGIEADNPDDWNSRCGTSWTQAASILREQFIEGGSQDEL